MSLKGAINSASDLYRKLQVESKRLEKEVTDHDFHNFVKTARELFEWIEKDNSATRDMRRKLINGKHLRNECDEISNEIKHFKEKSNKFVDDVASEGGYGIGRIGKGRYGVGERSIKLIFKSGNSESLLDFKGRIMSFFGSVFKSMP